MSLADNCRLGYQSRTGSEARFSERRFRLDARGLEAHCGLFDRSRVGEIDVTGHEAGRVIGCAFVDRPWRIGVDRLHTQVSQKKQDEEGLA